MERLIAYGCSWTEGEGCDLNIEKTLSRNEQKKFRNSNSWPLFLSKKLNIKSCINKGISSCSNRKIFNDIISDVENKNITSDDFVCIMFSSSLRDYVPFLPNGEWISWSVKHLINTPDKFYNSYHGVSAEFNDFLSDYKKFFITNLFSQDYYNFVNQNYIIFLQKLFKHYKIKYIMLESFDTMLHPPLKNNFTYLIDYSTIFGKLETTTREMLKKTKRTDIWEVEQNYDIVSTQHPNKKGYEIIANELYNFIIKNNII